MGPVVILVISILIDLAINIFLFMGILAHKKCINKQLAEIIQLKKQLHEQTKRTIKATNDLLILQEQTKTYKRQ